MYYPRFRPENRQRSDNWHQNRTHRTRSEDYSCSHQQPKDNVTPPTDLVEETLRKIRARRPSETMSTNATSNGDVDNRRLSCDEIDQVLNHIRSRSQSLSSRPPPPKASPPPLPKEEASYTNFDLRNTPFGNVRSSPPSRRFHQTQQQQQPQPQPSHVHRSRPRERSTTTSATSSNENPSNHQQQRSNREKSDLTEDEISKIIESQERKRSHCSSTFDNDARKRQSITEDDIGRIIDDHKQKQQQPPAWDQGRTSEPTRDQVRTSESSREDTLGRFAGGDKVWHHNPAYDAPKPTTSQDTSVVDEHSRAAFETVRELNERLQTMSEDLDRVRAAADKISEDLQREMSGSSNAESDYENNDSSHLEKEKNETKSSENQSTSKEDKPEQSNYFRKINVTLSSGKNDSKKIPVFKSNGEGSNLGFTRNEFTKPNEGSVPIKKENVSKRIPVHRCNEEETKKTRPEFIQSNEKSVPTTSRKINISTDNYQSTPKSKNENCNSSAKAKNQQEPTETNKVIITELSSSEDESIDEDDNSSESGEESPSVYNATVRTTHIRRPKKVSPVATIRKKRHPTLQKIGRPESIYIDSFSDEHNFGERLSLADQKKEEGNELYKTSNYREALQRYSEAISLCPETPAFYGNRAACYMMLAQFARALEDARTSVQLDPQFTKGYIRVAKCCIATGDIASARQALETALSLEPNNSAVTQENNALKTLQKHQTDATNAFNAGDHRKALFCLDRALEVATASRNLKLLRAECLAYLGRYGEAQEVANDLLRQDSTNVDAIFVRGLCLYYEDNVDKAFTHFQQVLRFAPDHQRAKDIYKKAKLLRQKKEEGNAAFKSSKWTEAYDLYTEALAIDPCNKFTNAKLYFNRATVAAKLKKLKESIEDCSAALALDEKYMKALLRRAKSYMDLEMFEEAVRDYEAAQRSDRGNREYHQLLQHAKLELKKSKRKDYYKILGVERGASDEEIKRAYRKRALVHHPDRHSSSTEEEKKEHEKKFKEIGEAYGVLSDAKKRSRYDNGYDIDDLEGGGGHGGFGGDIDPDQIFKAFFSGGGGHHHGGGHHPFGGFGGGAGPSQMPGGFSFQFG